MRTLQPCGTYAAYQRHRLKKEQICEACKVARREYMEGWTNANPSLMSEYSAKRTPQKRAKRTPSQARDSKLRNAYGINSQQWEELFEFQGRICASCRSSETHGRALQWQVDHNHKTGVLRGIACARCNRLVGQLGDDAASVASNCTRFLAYLAASGDLLSADELNAICIAIRSHLEVRLKRAEGAHPDRSPRPRYLEIRKPTSGRPKKWAPLAAVIAAR